MSVVDQDERSWRCRNRPTRIGEPFRGLFGRPAPAWCPPAPRPLERFAEVRATLETTWPRRSTDGVRGGEGRRHGM